MFRLFDLLVQDREVSPLSISFRTTPSLNFIAPQTRMRVVDNSQFSSIAPEQKKTAASKKIGLKQAANADQSAAASKDTVKDVKAFLQIGTNAASKRKPLVIRVYNHKNRGTTGKHSPTCLVS